MKSRRLPAHTVPFGNRPGCRLELLSGAELLKAIADGKRVRLGPKHGAKARQKPKNRKNRRR